MNIYKNIYALFIVMIITFISACSMFDEIEVETERERELLAEFQNGQHFNLILDNQTVLLSHTANKTLINIKYNYKPTLKFIYHGRKPVTKIVGNDIVELNNLSKKHPSIKQAKNLYNRLFINKEHTAAVQNFKTDNNPQLNFLCIHKVKQVANTNRIFRASENNSEQDDNLSATIRLNGTHFYNMNCTITDTYQVSKLILLKIDSSAPDIL